MWVTDCMGGRGRLAVAVGFCCCLASGCGPDFRTDYEIPSPSGEYIALLGSRTGSWDHHLRILREGQIVLDKELWPDRIESGIAAARWSSDGSEFAVKILGDDVRLVAVFNVSTGRAETFQGTGLAQVPAWTGLDGSWKFDPDLEAYRVEP